MSNQSDLAKSAAGFNGDPLSIDTANNRVGIGTSSPARNLVVNSGASSGYIQLVNTASGTAASNGFDIKLDSAGAIVDLKNRENGDMRFWTNNTEHMRIDSAGRVTMPSQPSFRVQGNGAWTTFSNGAYTTIDYDTVHHNIGNHFNTSTNTFTAPVAGRYIFTLSVYARLSGGQGDNTNHWFAGFIKNGSASNNTSIVAYQNDGDYDFGYTQTEIYSLAANDTMNIFARAAGSYNGEYYRSNCYFGGHLLG